MFNEGLFSEQYEAKEYYLLFLAAFAARALNFSSRPAVSITFSWPV
jgi:hypothetical protein